MLTALQTLLKTILPLKQLTVVCQFTQNTKLPCFHQTVFPAYFYTLLDRLPPEIAKQSCRFVFSESGQKHYQVGDEYRFSIVFWGQKGVEIAEQLIKKIPYGITASDTRALHKNLKIIELIDGFSGQIIQDTSELCDFNYAQLQRQQQQLNHTQLLQLHCNTGMLFNTRITESNQFNFNRLFQQLCLSVLYASNINEAEKTQTATQIHQQIDNQKHNNQLTDNHWFFVRKTYTNQHSGTTRVKHLSGYHGQCTIQLCPNFPYRQLFIEFLLIGQYLGIGKRTNYGIGQYHIIAGGITQKQYANKSKTLLSHLLSVDTITRHRDYVRLPDKQKQIVLKIVQNILSNTYQPSAIPTYKQKRTSLNGIKKTRTIAVVPLAERVIQKILAQQLSDILDSTQHHSSYGYRPNRHRKQAIKAVQNHIKNNAKNTLSYVLESDISNCFDSISLQKIHVCIYHLLGDKGLADVIQQCLSAPLYNTQDIKKNWHSKRKKGIPQGAPLSPLIANIILSDLDYDLAQKGYKSVRFADDFIVCTSSKACAEKALLACEKSLQEQGLILNKEKTKITQVSEGFVFLGYHIDYQTITDLSQQTEKYDATIKRINQTGQPAIHKYGQTLFICYQKHSQLSLKQGYLVITTKKGSEKTPLSHIRQMIVLGGHHLTTPLVQYCLRQRIDITYLSHTGEYLGYLSGQKNTHHYQTNIWRLQNDLLAEEKSRLLLSKKIVTARLHNMSSLLSSYKIHTEYSLKRQTQKVEKAISLAQLRGIEGISTRSYYLYLNRLLKNTDFNFKKRSRRPPKDPFNVLLSLGYTILYQYLKSFLLSLSLNPDSGFYHATKSQSQALCSDLIEPFRHLIERSALTVIRRKQIQTHHFYYHNHRCCLTAEGRKIYIYHISKRLEGKHAQHNVLAPRNIEYIYQQAQQFLHCLKHSNFATFTPHTE